MKDTKFVYGQIITTDDLYDKYEKEIKELDGMIVFEDYRVLIIDRLKPLIENNKEFFKDFTSHTGYVLQKYTSTE